MATGAKLCSLVTKVRPKEPNYGAMRNTRIRQPAGLVGLLGFEPRTKGFTFVAAFPLRVDYLFTRR